jgi:hypothetical protein
MQFKNFPNMTRLHPADTKGTVLTIVILLPYPERTDGGSRWNLE